MDISFSPEEKAFRQEVRRFLDAELSPQLRKAGRECSGIYAEYGPANAWHRILARRGWSVPAWPVQYGGTGWTPTQQYIFKCELAAAEAPEITPNATHMVAPVIMAFGTTAQKERYLPRSDLATTGGRRAIPNPAQGRTLPRCAVVRCATPTITSSTGRRSGRRMRISRTGSSASSAHAHWTGHKRGSRFSCSTWICRASRFGR